MLPEYPTMTSFFAMKFSAFAIVCFCTRNRISPLKALHIPLLGWSSVLWGLYFSLPVLKWCDFVPKTKKYCLENLSFHGRAAILDWNFIRQEPSKDMRRRQFLIGLSLLWRITSPKRRREGWGGGVGEKNVFAWNHGWLRPGQPPMG